MSTIGTTRSGKPIHDVTHAAYTSRHRFTKWNITPTALHEPKLLKRTLSSYTREDHEDAAEEHEAAAENVKEKHAKAADAASKKYGVPEPYRWISGDLQESWPRVVKNKIGNLARKASAHREAMHAHMKAMKFRSGR